MDIKDFIVPLAELRHTCDPAEFPFTTTDELKPRDEVIRQARAVNAIEFGLAIKNHGYNIFVSGIPGTGRNTIVSSIVKRIAQDRPVPDDWCYINNFKDPDRPLSVKLSPGKGRELQRDMEKFIELMLGEIPKVFESKEYEEQKTAIQEELERAKEVLFEDTGRTTKEMGFQLSVTRTGIVKVPLLRGKPLQSEDLEKLSLTLSSALWLTAMAANPLGAEIAREYGVEISFGSWLLAPSVPTLLGMVLLPLLLYKVIRPEVTATPDAPADARKALKDLGPPTRDQKVVAGTFLGMESLWGSASTLGIDSTAVAFLGLGVLLATRVLTLADIAKEGDVLATFIWLASLFTMSDELNQLGFMEFLGGRLALRLGRSRHQSRSSHPWST